MEHGIKPTNANAGTNSSVGVVDVVNKGFLLKRKDFLGVDELAHSHPNRTYYYRKNHDLDNVIETCTKKLQNDPLNSKALFLRGSSLVKKRQYTEAIEDFSNALETDSKNVECLYHRGSAYMKIDEHDRAILDFTAVLKLNPNHVNAAFARAACFNSIGLFSRAIEDYNFALMKDTEGSGINAHSAEGNGVNSERQSKSPTLHPSKSTSIIFESPYPSALDVSFINESNKLSPFKGEESYIVGHPELSPNDLDLTRERSLSQQPTLPTNLLQQDDDPPPSNPKRNKIKIKKKVDPLSPITPPPTSTIPDSTSSWDSPNSAMSTLTANTSMPPDPDGSNGLDISLRRGAVFSTVLQVPKVKRPPPAIPHATVGHDNLKLQTDLSIMNQSSGALSPLSLNPSQPRGGHSTPTSEMRQLNTSSSNAQSNASQNQKIGHKLADEHYSKGYLFRRKGDFLHAVEEYSKALEIDPHHFKALFNRGFAYDKLGLFEKAVHDYNSAIASEPKNAFAYYNRGISLDRMGMLQDAYQDFTEAIQLQPNTADFHHNRAFCLRKMGNLPEAIEDYTAALEITPGHFKALFNRSFCLERLGRLDEALIDVNAALEQQPTHTGSLAARALLYERLGRLDEALTDFTTALQHNGNTVPLLSSRAKVFAQMGRFTEAIQDLSQALQEQPNDLSLLFSRAMCNKSTDRYLDAIHDFSGVIRLDPQQALAYNHRGFCYRKLEEWELAIQDYSQAIRLSPDNLRAFNNRAFVYTKIHQYREAVEDYSSVIQMDPTNSHAYHNRGISYDKMGLFDQAIADFTKVMELDALGMGSSSSVNNFSDGQVAEDNVSVATSNKGGRYQGGGHSPTNRPSRSQSAPRSGGIRSRSSSNPNPPTIPQFVSPSSSYAPLPQGVGVVLDGSLPDDVAMRTFEGTSSMNNQRQFPSSNIPQRSNSRPSSAQNYLSSSNGYNGLAASNVRYPNPSSQPNPNPSSYMKGNMMNPSPSISATTTTATSSTSGRSNTPLNSRFPHPPRHPPGQSSNGNNFMPPNIPIPMNAAMGYIPPPQIISASSYIHSIQNSPKNPRFQSEHRR